MKPYVVGLGEVLWDVLPEGKKLGGAPANFAYHVSQLLLSGKSFTRQKNKAETLLWDFSLFCYFACCKKKL